MYYLYNVHFKLITKPSLNKIFTMYVEFGTFTAIVMFIDL